MNNFSLIYNVFTFAFGLGTLFTYILAVIKTKSIMLFHILFFYIVFTLSSFFGIYYTVINSQSGLQMHNSLSIVSVISLFISSLFIFSIPFFSGYIAFVKHQRVRNSIFAAFSLLTFLHGLLELVYAEAEGAFVRALINFPLFSILLTLSIAYSILCGVINFRKIEDREYRRLVRNVCIVAGTFFPFTVINEFTDYIFPVSPLLYCSFCVVFIIFIFRIYFRDYYITKEAIEANSFDRYNLSDREREVISLLLQGYSNKKIADMLFISVSTVKTHIHNVFKKTNSSNRYELIHLIKFR